MCLPGQPLARLLTTVRAASAFVVHHTKGIETGVGKAPYTYDYLLADKCRRILQLIL